MNKDKLMNLIYDKLADNDDNEQFSWENVQDMCIATENKNPLIIIEIDGFVYELSVKTQSAKEYYG